MNLYEWGCSVPWCITDEALSAMLAIAAREDISPDDLKQVMHGPKALALRDGKRREGAQHTDQQNGVARIVIDGPIYRYADYFTKYSGGVTTEALAREFQAALDDPAIGAIALIIDSPGGEATGINELADTIYAARGRKPIGAYIEGYGASAAYWIGSAADVVTVDESALVGSIGTVMGVPDPSKRAKYTIDFVSSQSPKKRVDPSTEGGAAYLQSLVDDMTEVFIAKVMRNRGITRQEVLAVEGGMRIGQAAVSARLADRIGSEDQLLRELAMRATNVPPTPPARMPSGQPMRMEKAMSTAPDKKPGFWAWITGTPESAEAPETPEAPASSTPATAPVTAVQPAQPAPDPALKQRLDELEAQLSEQAAQARQASAAAFADGAVRNRHALPSERQALYTAYVQAAEDDQARPLEQTRVAQLEALVEARPQHSLFDEQIVTNPAGALGDGKSAASQERIDASMAMTPLGQAALSRRRAKGA